MKRIIGFILFSAIILSCFPLTSFAEVAGVYSGVVIFDNNAADTLTINGIDFNATKNYEFQALIKVSDSTNTLNQIQLNGNKIADLVDGENTVSINTENLINGENELMIVLGAGNSLYSKDTVYGNVNIDDIVVESVRFENIGFSTPKSANYYLPTVGAAGVTKKSVNYSDKISVGDGWISETGLGGNSPNVPVFIGYVFDYSNDNSIFNVDTTKIKDGEYVAQFKNNGKIVSEKKIIIDNSAPVIEFSIKDGALVSKLQKVTYNAKDITNVKTELLVDGKRAISINPKKLSYGKHVAVVTATDAVGNKSINTLRFEITEKLYHVEFFDDNLNIAVLGNGDIYSGQLLKDIRMFENRYGAFEQDYLRSEDEVLISFDNKADLVTESIGDSVP